jgi:ATP-binding cassette, subfamily C, bacterial
VLLDGVPVTRYPPDALPRLRILIPQEAYVFAGTLAANICYLCPNAPLDARIDAAAEAVGLSPLVSRLGGYQAIINPARLSAGERQLIALTRAYLSPAPIAILDEATCRLDPAAEAAFTERGGTLIVIAHRISSALRARRVLVLDGTRPQAGDHDSQPQSHMITKTYTPISGAKVFVIMDLPGQSGAGRAPNGGCD